MARRRSGGLRSSRSPTSRRCASATWLATPGSFKLSTGQGTKTVYAWVKDQAGNISAVGQRLDHVLGRHRAHRQPDHHDHLAHHRPGHRGHGRAATPGAARRSPSTRSSTARRRPRSPPLGRTTMPDGCTLKVGNGVHNVSLFVKDAAGNVSAASTKQITLTPPKPTVDVQGHPEDGHPQHVGAHRGDPHRSERHGHQGLLPVQHGCLRHPHGRDGRLEARHHDLHDPHGRWSQVDLRLGQGRQQHRLAMRRPSRSAWTPPSRSRP